MGLAKSCAVALAFIAGTMAQGKWYPEVLNDGQPAGVVLNVSGTEIYHSYPPSHSKNTTAILYITDIFGLPLLQNKLLADSIAKAGYLVVLPDLFKGDAIPVETPERGLNLTEWFLRHPTAEIDSIVESTIKYIRTELGAKKIGGVGYCLGGKYVPRFLAEGKGLDAGFIAHPSNLESSEIEAIVHPITIAAGELDAAFNSTGRHNAESILQRKNATYQLNLYSGAPHGFGVRVDLSVPRQKFAKESAFFQAVRWFDAWL